MHLRRQVGDVMEARTGAVEEHDVVRIALALQEHAAQIGGALRRDVFAQAETGLHVELAGLAHVRRQDLIMVDALGAAAAMRAEGGDHARHHRHGRAELERRADRIGDLQRAALMRHLGPGRGATFRVEKGLAPVEIGLGEHAHADARAGGFVALAQHQAVMAGLLDAAEIKHAIFFRAQRSDRSPRYRTAWIAARSFTVSTTWLARVIRKAGSKSVTGRLISTAP